MLGEWAVYCVLKYISNEHQCFKVVVGLHLRIKKADEGAETLIRKVEAVASQFHNAYE